MTRDPEHAHAGIVQSAVSGPPIRAPRGTALSCKAWPQEAILRLRINSLDPYVADSAPQESPNVEQIVAALRALENDETLFLRDDRLDVVRTKRDATRVVVASHGEANRPDSWLNIGPQGELPAASQALATVARKHYNGELAGKLVASLSMSDRSASVSLAATCLGAAFFGVDNSSETIKRRVKNGYCDVMVNDLDEALRILKNAVRKREAASVALVGDCAQVIAEFADRGVVPDILVDQADPARDRDRVQPAMATLRHYGMIVARLEARSTAAETDHETLFYIALSGEPSDVRHADDALLDLFPANQPLSPFIKGAQQRIRHQGLPARAVSLARTEQTAFARILNERASRGEFKAPLVLAVTREVGIPLDFDHNDALIAAGDGATFAAFQHSSSMHAQTIAKALVLDGTDESALRIARVFEK
jgi:urocanate hydratase